MDTDKPCSKIPDEVSETVKRAFLAGYLYAVFTGARLMLSSDSEPSNWPH